MLYREELLFVDDLVDAFATLNVESIPLNTRAFDRGVASMGDLLAKEDPEKFKELRLLFTQRPISGDYSRFNSAMMTLYGYRFHMESPKFGRAYFSSSIPRKVPATLHVSMAEEFCKASNTKYASK